MGVSNNKVMFPGGLEDRELLSSGWAGISAVESIRSTVRPKVSGETPSSAIVVTPTESLEKAHESPEAPFGSTRAHATAAKTAAPRPPFVVMVIMIAAKNFRISKAEKCNRKPSSVAKAFRGSPQPTSEMC